MFFVEGAHEAAVGPTSSQIGTRRSTRPIKDLTVLNTSGHRPLWEQPDEFVDYMVNTVLAQTNTTN